MEKRTKRYYVSMNGQVLVLVLTRSSGIGSSRQKIPHMDF